MELPLPSELQAHTISFPLITCGKRYRWWISSHTMLAFTIPLLLSLSLACGTHIHHICHRRAQFWSLWSNNQLKTGSLWYTEAFKFLCRQWTSTLSVYADKEPTILYCCFLCTTTSVTYWSELLATDPEVPGSIAGTTRFSEK
jgi:hypothetical protein